MPVFLAAEMRVAYDFPTQRTSVKKGLEPQQPCPGPLGPAAYHANPVLPALTENGHSRGDSMPGRTNCRVPGFLPYPQGQRQGSQALALQGAGSSLSRCGVGPRHCLGTGACILVLGDPRVGRGGGGGSQPWALCKDPVSADWMERLQVHLQEH